jgi:acetyl esterase/lipase
MKQLLLCLLLASAVPAFGKLNDDASFTAYHAIEDVIYGQKDGMGLSLDVLTPEKNTKGIGLVLVSSGSWKSSKSNLLADEERKRNDHWVQGLLKGGYTLFVVRHGSSPRYFVPEMIEDVRRAVRFVRLNAKKYHVDPDHLGITSGSSGGHLSLMVALTADDGKPEAKDPLERISSRLQAVVAWFPPTDMINWGATNGYKLIEGMRPGFFQQVFGKVTDLETQLKTISPIYHLTKDDPPLLLIHGDADKTVPVQQSKILKAKYDELGLPNDLVIKEGGGHTYWPGILENYPAVWNWFDRYLKPARK